MFLVHPAKENKKDVKLFGAVQISDTAFLVYKNSDGRVMLKTGGDEKLQKKAVKNMLEKNPAVKRLLDKYRIRPSINTKTLKELAGGHMNETCNIAKGVYEILASSCEPEIDEATVKEASMLHDLGKILIPFDNYPSWLLSENITDITIRINAIVEDPQKINFYKSIYKIFT